MASNNEIHYLHHLHHETHRLRRQVRYLLKKSATFEEQIAQLFELVGTGGGSATHTFETIAINSVSQNLNNTFDVTTISAVNVSDPMLHLTGGTGSVFQKILYFGTGGLQSPINVDLGYGYVALPTGTMSAFFQRVDGVYVLIAPSLPIQYYLYMDTIPGSGASAYAGQSIALSDDGTVLAIGEYLADSSKGQVSVYKYDGTTWNLQGTIPSPTGTTSTYFGYHVSISDDGQTLAVSMPIVSSGSYTNNGRVYIFTSDGTTWNTTPVAQLDGTTSNVSYYAMTISLSGDGLTLAVGHYDDNSSTGQVTIFENNGGTWGLTPVQTYLGQASYVEFGHSVSLSADGSLLAIGADGSYNSSNGWAYLYTRPGAVGTTWNVSPTASFNSGSSSQFGYTVALSHDKTTLAVTQNSSYTIFIYRNTGSGWTNTPTTTITSTDTSFGMSLSITNNGSILAIGAPLFNSQAGRFYAYNTATGSLLLSVDGINSYNRMGWSVAIDGSGSVLASGAPYTNSSTGYVVVYTNPYIV